MVWQASITNKLSRRIGLNKVVIEDLMLILMAPRWTNQGCLQAFWTCPYLSITTTSNFASVIADILQLSPSVSDSPVFSRMAALYDKPKEICFLEDVSSRRAQPHRDSTSSVYDTSDQPSSIGAIHKRFNPISPSVRGLAECLLFLLVYQVPLDTFRFIGEKFFRWSRS